MTSTSRFVFQVLLIACGLTIFTMIYQLNLKNLTRKPRLDNESSKSVHIKELSNVVVYNKFEATAASFKEVSLLLSKYATIAKEPITNEAMNDKELHGKRLGNHIQRVDNTSESAVQSPDRNIADSSNTHISTAKGILQKNQLELFKNNVSYAVQYLIKMLNISNSTSLEISDQLSKISKHCMMVNDNTSNTTKINCSTFSEDEETITLDDDIASDNKQYEVIDKLKNFTIVVYHIHQERLKQYITQLNMSKCVYYNCKTSHMFYITNGTIQSDVVVFQGNRMPAILPAHGTFKQVFVFMNNEPPKHVHFNDLRRPFFHNYFNWTMTYRVESDIFMPYGTIFSISKSKYKYIKNMERGNYNAFQTFFDQDAIDSGKINKNYTGIFLAKSRTAVWLVSHCNTHSMREKYINIMLNFTDIDVFGLCRKKQTPYQNSKYDKIIETKYKFYMAFENSLCKDYITEKVYSWFLRDIIVVVRGGLDYSRFLPKGTYINANDFKSPEELAKHLNMLGSNMTEYLKVLQRKDRYQIITEAEHVQIGFCRLCYMINNLDGKKKSVDNIHVWWKNDACQSPKDV